MTQSCEIYQVLFSIKINPNQMKKGRACGISQNLVTSADQAAKRARDEATAGATKATRLGRVDTVGEKVYDGGNLLFTGRESGKETYLCPARAIRDLVVLDFHISSLEIMKKEGDQTGGFLRIQFSKDKPTVKVPGKEAAKFIDSHLNRAYRACYGYINPPYGDDPINTTFNFSGPVVEQAELAEHAKDLKDLRIISATHPGHAKCVRRN